MREVRSAGLTMIETTITMALAVIAMGSVAFLAVRTWPWVLVGLVALVLFPKGSETSVFEAGAQVAKDREMAYPILMKLLLPPGALGLLFASLLAAFMSTFSSTVRKSSRAALWKSIPNRCRKGIS